MRNMMPQPLSHLVTIIWHYRSFSGETRDIWATSLFKQLQLMAFHAISGMSPNYLWFVVAWLDPERGGSALQGEIIAWEHCRMIQFLWNRRNHKFGEAWLLWRGEKLVKVSNTPAGPFLTLTAHVSPPCLPSVPDAGSIFFREKGVPHGSYYTMPEAI